MQINAISSVAATPTTDYPSAQSHGLKPQEPTDSAGEGAIEQAKKVFTPAPPLRPNIQDVVDINRVLIAMRGL